jgi:DNA-directed RNA polymerase beta' subunit
MNNIDVDTIKGVRFSILSNETTKAISNVSVIKPLLYTNNYPTESGPFDLHLGSIDNNNSCLTCNYKKKIV